MKSSISKRRNASSHTKEQISYADIEVPDDKESLLTVKASFAVFLTSFILYSQTCYPSVPGGDSSELITSACELGVAHPPGYPLWTMMSVFVIKILPFSPSYSVTLLTCICAACSCSVLFALCYRLTSSYTGSALAAILFCTSPLTWTWSITAEVFALNNLLITLLISALVQFEFSSSTEERFKSVCKGAFLSGLSMTNQHTSVLFIAAIIVRIIYKLIKNNELTLKILERAVLYGFAGLLPYIYLPLSAYLNYARWSWGDQSTLHGFFTHLLRTEYGSFDLGKDQKGQGFLYNVYSYKANLLQELTMPGYTLACLGIIQTFIDRRESIRRTAENLLAMLVLYVSFFCWRTNLDVASPLFKGVVERFWLQPLIIWSILTALGLKLLLVRLEMRKLLPAHTKFLLVTSVIGLCLALRLPLCNHRQDTVVNDFAEAMIHSFPENSIVLTRGDLPSGTLRYKQYCEGVRPDLTFVEQELMTYDWFIPKMKSHLTGVVLPGDRWFNTTGTTVDGLQVFNLHKFIEINYKKPIFVCIGMQEIDASWKREFVLLPYGSCHQVVRSAEHWAENSHPFSIALPAIYKKYDPTSWESVANEEMWSAKINKALFLWSAAVDAKDPAYQAQLFLLIHQMYKDILMEHEVVPNYYHKNYALACERVARLRGTNASMKRNLLEETVKHFQIYIDSGEQDTQLESIAAAVSDIRHQLKALSKV